MAGSHTRRSKWRALATECRHGTARVLAKKQLAEVPRCSARMARRTGPRTGGGRYLSSRCSLTLRPMQHRRLNQPRADAGTANRQRDLAGPFRSRSGRSQSLNRCGRSLHCAADPPGTRAAAVTQRQTSPGCSGGKMARNVGLVVSGDRHRAEVYRLAELPWPAPARDGMAPG